MRHWKFSAQLKLTTTSFWNTMLHNGESNPNVLDATRCPHLPVSTGPSGSTDPCRILHWREKVTASTNRIFTNTNQEDEAMATNTEIQPCPLKKQNNTTSELNGNAYYEISFSLNTVRMRRASRWRNQFKHGWQNRITLLNCCPVIQQLYMLISKIA
jgi:hypothetical protein